MWLSAFGSESSGIVADFGSESSMFGGIFDLYYSTPFLRLFSDFSMLFSFDMRRACAAEMVVLECCKTLTTARIAFLPKLRLDRGNEHLQEISTIRPILSFMEKQDCSASNC